MRRSRIQITLSVGLAGLLLAASCLGLSPDLAAADTKVWSKLSGGYWDDPLNWNGGMPQLGTGPTMGDSAIIEGLSNSADVIYRNAAGAAGGSYHYISLGNPTAGTTMYFSQSQDTLPVEYFHVGTQPRNLIYRLTGGTCKVDNLSLGSQLNNYGQLNLSGSGSIIGLTSSGAGIKIGDNGAGRLNQTGGYIDAYSLSVGSGTGWGDYVMTAGTAFAEYLYVGQYGGGNLNLSGGTIYLKSMAKIGSRDSTATLALSGNACFDWNYYEWGDLNRNSVDVGYDDRAGTITQTGNSAADIGNLRVGANSQGTYEMTGGYLWAGEMAVGHDSTGLFLHSYGEVNIYAVACPLDDPTCPFTYVPGYWGRLRIGSNDSGIGEYRMGCEDLGCAYLVTDETIVGERNIGSFSHFYAVHLTSKLILAGDPDTGPSSQASGKNSRGTYELTEGYLETAESIVGRDGKDWVDGEGIVQPGAQFIHNSGIHTITGTLTLGERAYAAEPSSGRYTFIDGSLTTDVTQVGKDGKGLFLQNGGVHTVNTLNIRATQGDVSGTYQLLGGAIQAGTIQNSGIFEYTEGAISTNALVLNPSSSLVFTQGASPIQITGSASFGGSLTVGGQIPADGSVKIFDLQGATVSGAFDQLNLPAINPDWYWYTSALRAAGSLFIIPKTSAGVPDTGITKCSNNSGALSWCPSPGQPFYGQDANYSINPPAYTKLAAGGVELPDNATSWLMVRDDVTGLVWEMKEALDTVKDYNNPHDGDNTYVWYELGLPAGRPAAQDMLDFIEALNGANYGGYSDWRMPTTYELVSLIDYSSTSSSSPKLNTAFFPHTKLGYYLSAEHYPKAATGYVIAYAWRTSFGNGQVLETNLGNLYSYVRAVRGGRRSGKIDNGDGTVTDIATGLMWQQDTAPAMYTWQQGIDYCENLTLAGYADWRLPTIKELASITEFEGFRPALNTSYFPNAPINDGYYHSSSTDKTTFSSPWTVKTELGTIVGYGKSATAYIRAVRGGNCAAQGGDIDGDTVCTNSDNCPDTANTDQLDSNSDGIGDACSLPCAPLSSTDTTCDGIDDDCDGSTDEDYVSQSTTCGTGACASTGTSSCASGAEQQNCAPGAPLSSTDTTCDSVDDDCDGTADEDCLTSCPAPGLYAPSDNNTIPLPAYSWQKVDGVVWYNVQVWSESANNYAMSKWYDPAVICDVTTCTATAANALYPGRYWWWLNIWYADRLCGFKIQSGGQYKEFIVQACTGPDLVAPNDTAPVAYRSTPQFVWEHTGIEWYAVQMYMPAGWIRTTWYDATVVCTGAECTATPYTSGFLGQHWWWLLTWSVDCGYQLQPGGNVLGFVVQ